MRRATGIDGIYEAAQLGWGQENHALLQVWASQFQPHDLIGANTVSAQQDDLSPPDMLVWGVAIPREHLQTAAVGRLESNGNSGSHAPDSHASSPLGIPSGIQMSDAIH